MIAVPYHITGRKHLLYPSSKREKSTNQQTTVLCPYRPSAVNAYDELDILIDKQHRFRPKRSCETCDSQRHHSGGSKEYVSWGAGGYSTIGICLRLTNTEKQRSCQLGCTWASRGVSMGILPCKLGWPLLPYMETVGSSVSSSVGSPVLPNMKKWATQWAVEKAAPGLPMGNLPCQLSFPLPVLSYMETVGNSVGSPLLLYMKKWAVEWAVYGNFAMKIRLPPSSINGERWQRSGLPMEFCHANMAAHTKKRELPISLPVGNGVGCPLAAHGNFAMQIRLATTSIYGNSGQLRRLPTTSIYGNSGQLRRLPTTSIYGNSGQRSGLPIGILPCKLGWPLLPYMETVGSSVGCPLLPYMETVGSSVGSGVGCPWEF